MWYCPLRLSLIVMMIMIMRIMFQHAGEWTICVRCTMWTTATPPVQRRWCVSWPAMKASSAAAASWMIPTFLPAPEIWRCKVLFFTYLYTFFSNSKDQWNPRITFTHLEVHISIYCNYRCVWDLEVGKREMEFDAHAGDVVTISLAPGGQILIYFYFVYYIKLTYHCVMLLN